MRILGEGNVLSCKTIIACLMLFCKAFGCSAIPSKSLIPCDNLGYKVRVAVQMASLPLENLERLSGISGRKSGKKVSEYVISIFKNPKELKRLGRGAIASSIFSVFWCGRLKLLRDFNSMTSPMIGKNCDWFSINNMLQSAFLAVYDTGTRLPADSIRIHMLTDMSWRYKDFLSLKIRSFFPLPVVYAVSSMYAWLVFITAAKQYRNYTNFEGLPNISALFQGLLTGFTTSVVSAPLNLIIYNLIYKSKSKPNECKLKLVIDTTKLFAKKESWQFMRLMVVSNAICRSIAAMATIWAINS